MGLRYNLATSFILWFVFLLHPYDFQVAATTEPIRKIHIVYMGSVPVQSEWAESASMFHHDMLQSVLGSHDAAKSAIVYSYWKSFNGFAAWLSASEAETIKNMDGVISVFESKKLELHTTRSWDFVGLPLSAKRNLNFESDVIIGMIDSGIWPESESFNDEGLSPPPSKWKGRCQTSANFTCNKKIIGAQSYLNGTFDNNVDAIMSPRDFQGHGTHTASTAAGNVVNNASLYGLAEGSARGGVPGARLAAYKVCWGGFFGCPEFDVLAAFDDAIHDGVDIISISIGSSVITDYFESSISIGSFHALKKGILTSSSAGNSGPALGSVSNYAPWLFTVAASTVDRQLEAELVLGNNMTFSGPVINTNSMEKLYPLIYGGDAPNLTFYTSAQSKRCMAGSLNSAKVAGKIVVCEAPESSLIGAQDLDGSFIAGAKGLVAIVPEQSDVSETYIIPAIPISNDQGIELRAYMKNSLLPVATISKSYTHKESDAPVAASFSSRGPNPITANILKPDITAPGVDILAAFPEYEAVTSYSEDKRFAKYNIISGTSMSCPHVSGAAAYVKSFHPDWSPSAIKSALMTTASRLTPKIAGNKDKELAYGSGQINPSNAIEPGLIYDIEVHSYIDMLCNSGYNNTVLRVLTGDNNTCTERTDKEPVNDLNYPSMMHVVDAGQQISATFNRIVTNVGPPGSTYTATVEAPSGVNVSVQPNTLQFTAKNQSLPFSVHISAKSIPENFLQSGALIWKYGKYSVRSPIVVSSALLW